MQKTKHIRYFAPIFTTFFLFQATLCWSASEKPYQNQWCAEHHGKTEFVLPDGARIDCLTDTLAVEVDWAKKWAEGLGQAKYYAAMTGKRGAVVLIVGPHDDRFVKRLRIAAGGEVDIMLIDKVTR